MRRTLGIVLALAVAATATADPRARPARVVIPGGAIVPFFAPRGASRPGAARRPVAIPAFALDTVPVTNAAYLRFVTAAPKWRRSAVPRVFAEATYLSHWRDDLDLGTAPPDAPVTQVSWFAATAYCKAQGGALPTTLQWEYAARDRGRGRDALRARVIAWYGQPSDAALAPVGRDAPNGYGVYDLVGSVWEWTEDFGGAMLGSDTRAGDSKDEALSCGAGSLGALDPGDYPTFMRYAFRASLSAEFTTSNLGFRCARRPR